MQPKGPVAPRSDAFSQGKSPAVAGASPDSPQPFRATPDPTRIRRRLLAISVVLVAVLVLLCIGVFAVFLQPAIVISDSKAVASGCIVPPQTVTYSFTLTNSGNGTGKALVNFGVDQVREASQTYVIPPRSSADELESLSIDDCLAHTYQVGLGSVTAA